MKILEIVKTFKKTTGMERAAYELSRNFIELGNKVFVLTEKVEQPLKKVNFIFGVPSKECLNKIKKNKKVDIIHSHGSESLFF